MNPILPECLLGYLFHQKNEIIIENFKFHKVIFNMKKRPEYKEILRKLKFSGSPINPYSETLDEALFNLQFAGALSRKNPELVLYSTSKNFNSLYDSFIKDIDEDQLKKLDNLSQEIFRKIC